MTYEERLNIPLNGSDTKLYSLSGENIANGYLRVVIGGRGPYVEFSQEQIIKSVLVPVFTGHFYYKEFKTKLDGVKVYFQIYKVDYADYIPGRYYISPFLLFNEKGQEIIQNSDGQLSLPIFGVNKEGEDE